MENKLFESPLIVINIETDMYEGYIEYFDVIDIISTFDELKNFVNNNFEYSQYNFNSEIKRKFGYTGYSFKKGFRGSNISNKIDNLDTFLTNISQLVLKESKDYDNFIKWINRGKKNRDEYRQKRQMVRLKEQKDLIYRQYLNTKINLGEQLTDDEKRFLKK